MTTICRQRLTSLPVSFLFKCHLDKSGMADISGRWRVFSYQQIFPVLVFIHIQVLSFFFLARCQQKVSWCYRALSKESSTLSKFSEQNMPDRKPPYKRTSRYLLGGHQCLRCSGGRLLDSVAVQQQLHCLHSKVDSYETVAAGSELDRLPF